ncbi:hypothetical protein ACFL2M_01130 [Patescibacteria group bacterium]
MKTILIRKLFIPGVLFIALVGVVLPFSGNAITTVYNVPANAVGIDEALFEDLSSSHCTYEYGCDPVIEYFKDSIVFRAQHFGELYWVNTEDGLPTVNRYLPDGFYKAGKKYYYVSEGGRFRMRKGHAWNRMVEVAGGGAVVPVSEYDFTSMLTTCENYSGVADDPTYLACVDKYNHGQSLIRRLERKVIMRVEANGELYYVKSGLTSAALVIPIKKKMDDGYFHKFIRDNAVKVPSSLMGELVRGVDIYNI